MSGLSIAMASDVAATLAQPARVAGRSNLALEIALFQARNVARSRWVLAYTAFFLMATEGLLRFSGSRAGTILSLANVILYIVPLVTLVVGSVYMYNAREFIELLLAQPVNRVRLFAGLYGGIALPLTLSLLVGVAVPFLVRGFGDRSEAVLLAILLLIGVTLTLCFTGVALVIALHSDDRLRGLTMAIAIWLFSAVVYDAGILAVVATFSDYPLERPLLALTLFNPIDLARVAVMLQLDVSALMGYTGAVFQQFLGGNLGFLLAIGCLSVWVCAPAVIGARMFVRKDF